MTTNAKLQNAKSITLPVVEPPRAASPGVLLTPEQLAERLAVPQSWVREKTRERARVRDKDPLPVVRLGKYVRFDWVSIQAWLTRQTQQADVKAEASSRELDKVRR